MNGDNICEAMDETQLRQYIKETKLKPASRATIIGNCFVTWSHTYFTGRRC